MKTFDAQPGEFSNSARVLPPPTSSSARVNMKVVQCYNATPRLQPTTISVYAAVDADP